MLSANSATFKEMGLSIGEASELLGQFEINGVDTSTALAALKKAQVNAAKEGKTLSDSLKDSIVAIRTAGRSEEHTSELQSL